MVMKPDFFIIGTQKAATGSLYKYLSQHRQIFMSSNKEPFYFSFLPGQPRTFDIPYPPAHPNARVDYWEYNATDYLITDLAEYEALFTNASPGLVKGEASTSYIYSVGAAQRIYDYNKDAKIIAVLRDPIERAYSAYMYYHRLGLIGMPETFLEAFQEADKFQHRHWILFWHMKQRGFYTEQVLRYKKLFGDRFKIYIYEEDIDQNLSRTLGDMFEFLGVDTAFTPDTSAIYGSSGKPSSPLAAQLYSVSQTARNIFRPFRAVIPRQLQQVVTNFENGLLYKEELPRKVKQGLKEVYKEDVDKLESIIQRDLSAIWS
jgi:hypothetical protein